MNKQVFNIYRTQGIALPFVLFCLSLLLFSNCKKEIAKSEFETTSGNLIKILDVDSVTGITPFAQFERAGGGYILIYQPGQGFENFAKIPGLVVVITDKDWNILKSQTLGGSGSTILFDAVADEFGNVYLCGSTDSRDIRKDFWGPTKKAAYLAKIDKDAQLLWEVAYSDTSTYYQGSKDERFFAMELLNNKPICVGPQDNNIYPFTPMLVSFDENGNAIEKRNLPTLYKGTYNFSYTQAYIAIGLAKINTRDIIVRVTRFVQQPIGGVIDTSSYLLRYNTATRNITWQQYYSYSSAQGDLTYYGKLGNGNLAFFDTYFNILNIMDASNGKTLNTITLRNNFFDGGSNYYFNTNPYMRGTIDGDLYFMGAIAKGSQIYGRKPFIIKLDRNGAIEYEKHYNIADASFYRVNKNKKGNLQILGDIKIFKSRRQKIFTACIDKNGNFIGDD